MKIIKNFKKVVFALRYKRAVKKADKNQKLFKVKYQVYIVKGKPRAICKQRLENLAKAGYFGKGRKMKDIEKLALYSTI